MIKSLTITALVAAATLGLSACSESEKAPAKAPVAAKEAAPQEVKKAPVEATKVEKLVTSDYEWSWQEAQPSPIGKKPFIKIIPKGDTGTLLLTGFSGCNPFRGDATQSGPKVSFTNVSISERACTEEGMMEQEVKLLSILKDSAKYVIQAKTLTLKTSKGKDLITLSLIPSS